MTYVPFGAECGDAFDEVWVRAADQGVGVADGSGTSASSGIDGNGSESSRILRVQIDVRCVEGTRHITKGQAVLIYCLAGAAILAGLISLGAFIAARSSKAVARA